MLDAVLGKAGWGRTANASELVGVLKKLDGDEESPGKAVGARLKGKAPILEFAGGGGSFRGKVVDTLLGGNSGVVEQAGSCLVEKACLSA